MEDIFLLVLKNAFNTTVSFIFTLFDMIIFSGYASKTAQGVRQESVTAHGKIFRAVVVENWENDF